MDVSRRIMNHEHRHGHEWESDMGMSGRVTWV
jgi:hypothetical protein